MKKKFYFLYGLVIVLLSACSNFLTGSDIKENINNQIKYTDSGSTTVQFYCNKNYGAIIPAEDKTVIIGETIDLSFKINSDNADNIIFKGWECVKSDDTSVSLGECVEFESVTESTTVKIIKGTEGILIRPVIIEYPKVKNIYPFDEQTGVPINDQIILVFNNNMNTMSDCSLLCQQTNEEKCIAEQTEIFKELDVKNKNQVIWDRQHDTSTCDSPQYFWTGDLNNPTEADKRYVLNKDNIRIYCVEDTKVPVDGSEDYLQTTVEAESYVKVNSYYLNWNSVIGKLPETKNIYTEPEYDANSKISDITDYFAGEFDGSGKVLSLKLCSKPLISYYYTNYNNSSLGITNNLPRCHRVTHLTSRQLPKNCRIKIWINPETVTDVNGLKFKKEFASTFITSDKNFESTDNGNLNPIILEGSYNIEKQNCLTDIVSRTKDMAASFSEDIVSTEDENFYFSNYGVNIRLKAGARYLTTNTIDGALIKEVHCSLVSGYFNDDGQFTPKFFNSNTGLYESTGTEIELEPQPCNDHLTGVASFYINLHDISKKDFQEKINSTSYRNGKYYYNLPDGYVRATVWVKDYSGNESNKVQVLFSKKISGPYITKDVYSRQWALFNTDNYVCAKEGKVFAYPCFMTGYKNMIVKCYKDDVLIESKFAERDKMLTDSAGNGYVVFDNLVNEQDYDFKFNIVDEEGFAGLDSWITRTVCPTAGLYRKQGGSGDYGEADQRKDLYFLDDDRLICSVPASSTNASSQGYYFTARLYLNKNKENTDSPDWFKVSVNDYQEFKWPDDSVDTYYAMIFYEKSLWEVNSGLEYYLPVPTKYFSKIFKIERGTAEAIKRLSIIGKIYYSDGTVSSAEDYDSAKTACGVVLEVYDESDNVEEADLFAPKTIWSFYTGDYLNSDDYQLNKGLNSFKTDHPGFDWRLPSANELTLMWKYRDQMYAAQSKVGTGCPGAPFRVAGQGHAYMFFSRGTLAVNEGEVMYISYYSGNIWPVVNLHYTCATCGKEYDTYRGYSACNTKSGCLGYTTSCSNCGTVYHTDEERDACDVKEGCKSWFIECPVCHFKWSKTKDMQNCGKTPDCPGWKTPVATYKFHDKISVLPAGTNGSQGTGATYVYFGDYPQSVKADDIYVDHKSKSVTMGSNTYYVGTDGNYYCLDSEVYYKVEPVKWVVLDKEYDYDGDGDKTSNLLSAENILHGGIPFCGTTELRNVGEDTDIETNNYEYSQLRAFLNGLVYYDKDSASVNTYVQKGFLQTAFEPSAVALIKTTVVNNGTSSTVSANKVVDDDETPSNFVCRNTNDKIFLLSYNEITKYSYQKYTKGDSSRIRNSTSYSKVDPAFWFLRSPALGKDRVYNVNNGGVLNATGHTDYTYGIAPAIVVDF